MTLRKFEEKLKKVRKDLKVKRYNGIAGVFLKDKYILRIAQGEILPFSEYHAYKTSDDKETEKLVRRGRIAVARQLYANKIINQKDIGYLGG